MNRFVSGLTRAVLAEALPLARLDLHPTAYAC